MLGFALPLGSIALAQSSVDVESEIWPVLRERCLHCHNEDLAEGQLRLDRKTLIEQGGHTGNVILGSVDSSELLRRLRSADENYRMPKDDAPLPDETVERFQRWIEQGAPWPDDRLLSAVKPPAGRDDPILPGYDRALQIRSGIVMLAWPALVWLIVVLLLERRKRSLRAGDATPTGLIDALASRLSASHHLIAVLLLAIAGLWMFHRSEVVRLETRNDESIAQLQRFNITEQALFPNEHTYYPQPDPPRHPPRLGGTYYRGNDERHPKLFNGGYYRTANLYLSLRDRRDEKLEWGDRVEPGELKVCVEIERAPFATRELFRDNLMVHNRMTRHLGGEETEPFAGVVANFETVVPGEKWRACYPIGEPTSAANETFSGMVYVCNIHGFAHYGVRYQVDLADGVIADDSQLWMGATFFADHLLRPPSDVIVDHEWFGFLPIPEIVGGNTEDPHLLGIPEHQSQTDDGVEGATR